MLIPFSDDDSRLSKRGYVTISLVVANILIFFLLQGGSSANPFSKGWSLVPQEITTGEDLVEPQLLLGSNQVVEIPHAPGPQPIYWTLLTSMFLHGGLWHLLGNMLFLWIFGDNVEVRFGMLVFIALYFASGLVGSFVEVNLDPDSVIPQLGASGAISGVMGAYLVLFPRNRVRTLIFYFIVSLPAVVVIGLWIGIQIYNGITMDTTGGGVAYGAHIGGFFAGVVLAFVLKFLIKKDVPVVFVPHQEGP